MSSKAYAKFTKSIKRCEELARTYTILAEARKQNQKIPAPKDIVRASAILSVAALDAYITDVFTEYLVPYLKKYKTDASLINLLSDAGLDTKEALNLLSMDRPYRRIRTLVSKYYSSYTTQRFDVIDKLFLPYRLNKITDNAQKMSGRKSLNRHSAPFSIFFEICYFELLEVSFFTYFNAKYLPSFISKSK